MKFDTGVSGEISKNGWRLFINEGTWLGQIHAGGGFFDNSFMPQMMDYRISESHFKVIYKNDSSTDYTKN